MPRRDGTGPKGDGPRTGRGDGGCRGGGSNSDYGRRDGSQRGGGRGRNSR